MSQISTRSILDEVQAGALASAEQRCRAILDRHADDPEALFLLALSLQQQGRLKEALTHYSRLVELCPNEAWHWANYATALDAVGELDAAEAAAMKAVELAPDDVDQIEQLGLLQLRRGAPIAARDSLLRAFALAPESPSIRIHAARACAACRDYRSEDLLQPWRTWLPLDELLQYELADAKAESGDVEAARELLEDLAVRAPTNWTVQLLLASVYERVNRLQDAEALLHRIIANGVGNDEGMRGEIAQQRAKLAMRRKDFALAREILEASGPRNAADYAHYFALAHACDKLGDAQAAMSALAVAHARQIEEFKVATPHFFEPDMELLPRAHARLSAADHAAWPVLKAPERKDSPIFIVGFPRSGTTLLEQMLDAHPHLQSMDERPFFNILANQLDDHGVRVPMDLGRLDQRDCDELRKGYLVLACAKVPRRWDAQLVDKNPLNMLWLPMIYRLYPNARFILALRHPCDVILSCYMQNFRVAPLAVAGQSLEHLARAYVAAMECWLYHVNLLKPEAFVSRYEDLVVDASTQTRKIADFLEIVQPESLLDFDKRAREKGYIATPSYTQVIEPINRKGMNRWQHYREYFQSALPILRPMLEHWNYTTD